MQIEGQLVRLRMTRAGGGLMSMQGGGMREGR